MVNEWLKKNTSITLVEMELKEVPSQPSEMRDKVAELTQSVNTIKSTNKTITQNNTYKTGLNSINLDTAIQKLERPTTSIITLTQERGEHMKTVRDANTMLAKLRGLHGTCPTCMQEVSKEFIEGLISEHSTELANANSAIASLNAEMSAIEKILKQISEQEKLKESYEFYHGHYDASIPVDLLDENALRKEIDELNNLIAATLSSISEVEKYNKSAEANNAKVSVIQEQLEVMKQDLVKHTTELQACSARLADLQVLQKAFSTTGLIAYKIENLVKDLEELVNQYLAELSYGRFQITFRVESDKLNVIVHDNDFEVTMEELSKGEVARVNTATLLAIRKLMQDLSNTRINLLVLDETMDNLDADGKERLVELLLREHHLNTFIVSHGYSHPLLEKVTVVKEDNISRIENA
jgi:DNA repair exonuclease SbcCD ATPase subunit